MDLTAGIKADYLVRIHSYNRVYKAYLSAISKTLLQRRRFQFPKTSRADTLTTRLFLW